jgi:hypothetical protein
VIGIRVEQPMLPNEWTIAARSPNVAPDRQGLSPSR